jgi:DNA repair exonuclease SbcCD ATPase subunit
MEITLNTLKFRNFMSYGNNETVVNLNMPGTTLIVGEDLDNAGDGKTANGTGKSTIINAVSYALFDQPVSVISKDKLVNNINKKNMVVSLQFTVGSDEYTVVRERKTKAGAEGNNVKLFKGKDDISQSINETNKEIERIIGMTHNIFSRIVVFAARNRPFFDLPATSTSGPNQKEFIEELFGLTILTEKAELLKTRIKSTKADLATAHERVKLQEAEHARHAQQIANANQRVINWESENATKIATLEDQIRKLGTVDVAKEYEIHNNITKKRSEIKVVKQELRETSTALQHVRDTLSSKRHILQHYEGDSCPTCKQSFTPSDDELQELKTAILKLEAEISELSNVVDELTQAVNVLNDEIEALEESQTVSDPVALFEQSKQVDAFKARVEDMKNADNPHLDHLDELENTKLPEVSYDDVDKLSATLTHQEFLLKLLTKKDSFVRKTLLDKNIPFLNKHLKDYLQALGLPHSVEFTHDMTAAITRFGTPLDFGNLSAGQQARVNLALSFAFWNVLQSLHSTVNVCMLDEVFDVGLDSVGVQLAARLVKKKAREDNISMFIISHREEISASFDRVLVVEFSKNFSNVRGIEVR